MNGRFLFRKRKRKWGFNSAWYHHAPPCGNAAILYVDSGGAVSDERVWMCIEGPMEDTGAVN